MENRCDKARLELFLGVELLDNVQALLGPSEGFRLHGRAVLVDHACEAVDLLLELVLGFVAPLGDELRLLVGAALLRGDVAERGAACFLDVHAHVLGLWAKLIAHGGLCLLDVRLAAVSSLLVEMAHSGPATSARVLSLSVDRTNLVAGEKNVSKYYIRVAVKLLTDIIPGRGLLDSSSSAC